MYEWDDTQLPISTSAGSPRVACGIPHVAANHGSFRCPMTAKQSISGVPQAADAWTIGLVRTRPVAVSESERHDTSRGPVKSEKTIPFFHPLRPVQPRLETALGPRPLPSPS